MRASVIIVVYNGRDFLSDCLGSLQDQTRPADEVIVVDNGSSDGSVELVESQFPNVVLHRVGSNVGFAAGCNIGVGRSTGDAVVFLNPDTVVDPECIAALIEPLESDPELGAVAASMVFARDPQVIASAGIEVYANGLALDRAIGARLDALDGVEEVFGPSGGAAAYRREALVDAGSLPEAFFMYLEDADLAWRLRLRGWRTVVARKAVVQHAYSASSVEGSAFKRRLLARNRIWLMVRCFPTPLLRRMFPRILAYEALVLGYALARGDRAAFTGRTAAIPGMRERWHERRTIQRRRLARSDELHRWIKPSPSPSEVLRVGEVSWRYAVRPATS